MRRLLGITLTLIGAALLLFVGVTYTRGAIAQDEARARWEALTAHEARVTMARQVNASALPTSYAAGAPIGRLLIPSIHLDEVVLEGVGDAELNAGPGHLPGSVLPGAAGNAVISAHRDRHFHALDAVAIGDTVVTETLAGNVTWLVVGRRVVERGQPAIFATTEPTLTLTTCWPVRYIGPAPDRLILTARPIHPRTGA